jgi:hypothetical protein
MVGKSVTVAGEDYGRIMRWVRVENNDKTINVFVFSSGRKVEAMSLIDYVKNKVYYPSGMSSVYRRRKAKTKSTGRPVFPTSIRNTAVFSSNVMPRPLPHEQELNNKLKNKKGSKNV